MGRLYRCAIYTITFKIIGHKNKNTAFCDISEGVTIVFVTLIIDFVRRVA